MTDLLPDVTAPGGHASRDVEENFLRGRSIVGEAAAGAELAIEASHVARMGLHVHLGGGGGGGGGGEGGTYNSVLTA